MKPINNSSQERLEYVPDVASVNRPQIICLFIFFDRNVGQLRKLSAHQRTAEIRKLIISILSEGI